MALFVEVFLLYGVYILLYSCFNSSEERVLVGRKTLGFCESIEVLVVHRLGCLIPYVLVYAQILSRSSMHALFGLLAEIAAYIIVKDSVIVYIKDLKIFTRSCTHLPINPSGHTFMLLNGIFILCPVLYNDCRLRRRGMALVSAAVIFEYNRLLISTVTYYHTFLDIALGVATFLLFRALVRPVRSLYRESAYENEWGVQGYFFMCAAVGALIFLRGLSWPACFQ
ncbi:uncharacterized protein NEMAJ01_1656 [Nematocida major]|uniref:uncharacterized protein n=1 Tax=Nematocida major TaxID=1912982 RepID=UPI002007EE19|nr:uncharacterized protein NEMAJ01_1656 [Nematocida major]KAH9386760.1 hypothetical protein NEMAJ01_1656 [Nematocida major]